MFFFYRITVYLRSQKEPIIAIRHNMFNDLENAWKLYFNNSKEAFPGNVEDYECVQVSRESREVKQYIKKHNLTKPDAGHETVYVPVSSPADNSFIDVQPPADPGANSRKKSYAEEAQEKYANRTNSKK